jgi:mono/diheme cytochrome c family protein
VRILGLLCFAGLLCGADVQTAPPWEKSRAAIGRDLFRQNCSVCHEIDKDQKHSHKFGPSLYHVFQTGQMVSHTKATRQYVILRVKFGGALMPAFQKKLSDQEIAELVDYIESK